LGAGAAADKFPGLGREEVAVQRIVAVKAHAAVQVLGGGQHPVAALGGGVAGDGHRPLGRQAGLQAKDGRPEGQAHGVGLDPGVGGPLADRLEGADLAAELFALRDIAGGHRQGLLGEAEQQRADAHINAEQVAVAGRPVAELDHRRIAEAQAAEGSVVGALAEPALHAGAQEIDRVQTVLGGQHTKGRLIEGRHRHLLAGGPTVHHPQGRPPGIEAVGVAQAGGEHHLSAGQPGRPHRTAQNQGLQRRDRARGAPHLHQQRHGGGEALHLVQAGSHQGAPGAVGARQHLPAQIAHHLLRLVRGPVHG